MPRSSHTTCVAAAGCCKGSTRNSPCPPCRQHMAPAALPAAARPRRVAQALGRSPYRRPSILCAPSHTPGKIAWQGMCLQTQSATRQRHPPLCEQCAHPYRNAGTLRPSFARTLPLAFKSCRVPRALAALLFQHRTFPVVCSLYAWFCRDVVNPDFWSRAPR